jgi:uncharacterized protein YjiS (DUF1127 family)
MRKPQAGTRNDALPARLFRFYLSGSTPSLAPSRGHSGAPTMSEPLVQEIGPSFGRWTELYPQNGPSSAISRWLHQIIPEWIARHRERKALMELSDHLLDDIGLSHEAALREATKPFWR